MLAAAVEADLFDPAFGSVEQLFAMLLQRFAALVDGDGFVKRHVAAFQPRYDAFQLGNGLFEGITSDVDRSVRLAWGFGHVLHPLISLQICRPADSASPSRS
jgi:hypothetical protein